MNDKNLFLYDLAVVAIFKNEGRYLREWLDYHLLAGVEHFYLYNNDSTDDYREVLAPYVEGGFVTLTDMPGKLPMYPAYDDAITRYRFKCRYMAFIDLDEFLYPKSAQSVAEVVAELLAEYPQAAALGVNWQCFGSNGQDKADYSRGVLERFTRRAPSDWIVVKDKDNMTGNVTIKSIVNPRRVECWWSPHYASYFRDFYSVNANGAKTLYISGYPVAADKIVVNHYYTKSREEYETKKLPKGSACFVDNPYLMEDFNTYDRNEEFDDGILKYRAARADSFTFERAEERLHRVEAALIETLTQRSPFDAPHEFFIGKLETFLTCRAVAELLDVKIGGRSAEEYALAWIYRTLNQNGALTYADLQLFVDVLPDLMTRPFPLAKKTIQAFAAKLLPVMQDAARNFQTWKDYNNLRRLQRLLSAAG